MTNYTKEFIYKFKNTCLENPFERSIEFYIPISKEKLVPSKNAWKAKIPRTEYDIIIKKVKGILNKISIDNFDKLSNDLYELKLSTQELVKDTIIIIVDKSINEPTFGDIYANLCLKLSKKNYNVDEKIFNFRNELVNQCQFKFEKEENFKKSIGNIKFIGELFNKDLLPSNVMINCVNIFLKNIYDSKEEEINIEKICKLLSTIGKKFEINNNKCIEDIINNVKPITKDNKYSARFRFMIKDLIDLKNRNWKERILKECNPKLKSM